jgi:site-specific DNA-cytosine methylase
MITVGSLFSGIGGFELGFDRQGFDVRWQVEIDPTCRSVLARHWPDVPRFTDVKEVGAHNLESVDIITFGSPCQDLSVAGKRGGLQGERSGLFFEAIRIIDELRPAIAIWENVPGAFSSNKGRDFGAALGALADLGALDIGWAVLDAQWFGVAQRRRRVFVVADFGGERAAEILALAEGLRGDSPPRREARQDPTPLLEIGARTSGDGERDGDGIGQPGDPMYTLQAGKQHGLAFGVSENQRAELRLTEVSRQLTTGGGKPGQGYPTVLVQETAGTLGSNSQGGFRTTDLDQMGAFIPVVPDVAYAIAAGQGGSKFGSGRHNQDTFIPISADAANGRSGDALTPSADAEGRVRLRPPSLGVGNAGDPSFTLSANGVPAVANTLTKESASGYDSSEDGTGRTNLIPIAFYSTEGSRNFGNDVDRSPPLKVGSGLDIASPPAIAFNWKNGGGYGKANDGLAVSEDHSPPLDTSQTKAVSTALAVRRLTPRECERLQGFPDDWTRYASDGKEISDSARYRMLGNAVCVNVSEWIARRCKEVSHEG